MLEPVPEWGMEEAATFKSGDTIVTTRRREWGVGVVEKATEIKHQGSAAQRLTVRFPSRGRVVLNTAIAPLAPRIMDSSMSTNTRMSTENRNGGWLDALEREKKPHELGALPEALSDPFVSLAQRLAATLETYRFGSDARGLLDWAIAQTGEVDPMTLHTHHEIEEGYARFVRDRDRHLHELVRQARREGESRAVREAHRTTTNPAAQAALKSAMRG